MNDFLPEHESQPGPRVIAFSHARLFAAGSLSDVVAVLKARFDADPGEVPLVFDVETGKQMDFDLRGSVDDVLAREAPVASRARGRPKLGVVPREVCLLPRQWEWLEAQPQGLSAALRRVVDEAMKKDPGRNEALRIRAALMRMLPGIAGDRPHYDDACRALYAGDVERFEQLVEKWPRDVRAFAVARAREAARADAGVR